ncbi:hypothetical protein BQ8482_220016 [Mesorhizobium delmotii]|uniref:Uncharacterized protein n=1 Tax=Mesorhizobium delmotii TaxID=1631247 RepID=A0A2P9AL19_9HYPH|nr:hypothetical protein BQ8482_220016 [Mesorhizobium delmotii]
MHAAGHGVERHIASENFEVGAHHVARPLCITGFDGLDHLIVLPSSSFLALLYPRIAVVAVKDLPDPGVVDEKLLETGKEILVVRHLSDVQMKLVIEDHPVLDVTVGNRLPELLLSLLEDFEVPSVMVDGCELRRSDVDHRSDDEEIPKRLVGHEGYARSAVGLKIYVALACHLSHEFAHRRTGKAEFLTKSDFVENRPRLELHRQDTMHQCFSKNAFSVRRGGGLIHDHSGSSISEIDIL